MKRRDWFMSLALLASGVGCSISLGNRGASETGTTLGKELMDLKEARDRGVITDAEYETQRQQLLHRDAH